jgi:propionate CoA-transferase
LKLISADDAAALIQCGSTVASAGFLGAGHAEAITEAIERRFLRDQAPRDLTLIYSAGQGDRATRGVNHFCHRGLTRRVIGGHWRSAPGLAQLALEEGTEAYNLPQGVISQLYRAIAGRKPGVITPIGLHTFVDPRHGGGKLNQSCSEELVELISIGGEEYLRYKPLPIDCALIRATTADALGNLSAEHEPFHHELLAIAQAARNSGGIVIAQVKRLVGAHPQARAVCVPGILVDYVVVVGEHPHHHSMTFGEYFNPAYTGLIPRVAATARARPARPLPAATAPGPRPADPRRIIQRRALLELAAVRPRTVNLGVGMPAGVGALSREAGIPGIVLTVESGPIGGTPADGLSFGAAEHPQAIVDEPAQFDFYDGGGLDMAFLGMAEADPRGNVNVGLFGVGPWRRIAGVGGFINITQSTRELVFMGTLTSGGLLLMMDNGNLRIEREGRWKKMVPQVGLLCFNGEYASRQAIRATYVTERAVFRLHEGRLTLCEVAPGLDVERDVLALLPPGVAIAPSLSTMDARVFQDGPIVLDDAPPSAHRAGLPPAQPRGHAR